MLLAPLDEDDLLIAVAIKVAVHDAARPAASQILIDRIFSAAQHHNAVIPAVPVRDTIKRVSADPIEDAHHDPLDAILGAEEKDPSFEVERSVDRDRLVAVQTPQVFERSLFERAYAQDDLTSTDDAGLVERLGERVITVMGEETNLKLTRQEDLPILRAVMNLTEEKNRAAHKRF